MLSSDHRAACLRPRRKEGTSIGIRQGFPPFCTVLSSSSGVIQTPDFLELIPCFARGLLEDAQFHDAVRRSLDEPIPYFSQFRSAESAELQDRRLCSSLPSRVSTLPDPYSEEDGERQELRQENSPSCDLLKSWEKKEQLKEHEEMMSR